MPLVGGPHTRITNPKRRTAAILEKSKNRHISAAVWPIFTKFGRMMQFDPLDRPTVKNLKFSKFKMAAAAILKNRKLTYLLRGFSDFDKIWHSDAVRPSWPFRSLRCKILKIQACGCLHLEKCKIVISWQLFDHRHEIWHGDAIRHVWCVPQFKLCNFKNPTWRPPLFWKIEKSPYLGHSFNKILLGDAVWPSWPFGPLQIWDLKKSKMAAAGILTI